MTGLDLRQLKMEVVRPALQTVGLWSPSAENLVTGTALAESRVVYLRQVGGGPALGLWQMEPATHDDCWKNWLCTPGRSRQATALRQMIGCLEPSADLMVWNLKYAAGMARIQYQRVPAPLPRATDAAGLSQYHKDFYNTPGGAADPSANVVFFSEAISA
ncbi:hypothetical protein NKW43_15435 [Gluconobacter albidus]|uniref:hypothetical protein n=1 Tax=Gluconobacter albidus TaxID=318683 RepID=UPI0020A186C8|nr:hypothetical protein [Gluconobacter albidus]MCP1275049.1 hypothetical protein [Gluconobacter albidus]